MLLEELKEYKLLLGSKSPRRRELLRNAGFDFELINIDAEESYDKHLRPRKVAEFLSKKKALAYGQELGEKEILITSDTIVVYKGKILGKPKDSIKAKQMLSELSGKSHKVITGFCLRSKDRIKVYSAISKVTFSDLSVEEIDYYVDSYKPMDKAGAYGIQEWIGHIGVEKIEGSYYNVMGLPIQKLYRKLEKFISLNDLKV